MRSWKDSVIQTVFILQGMRIIQACGPGRTQSSRQSLLQGMRIIQACGPGRTQSSRQSLLQGMRIIQAVATGRTQSSRQSLQSRQWPLEGLSHPGSLYNPGSGHWKGSVIQAIFTIQAVATGRTQSSRQSLQSRQWPLEGLSHPGSLYNPGGGHCFETRAVTVRPIVGSGKRMANRVKELLSTVTVLLVSEHSTINTFFLNVTKFRY